MVDDLPSILDLEPIEQDLFRGQSFDPGWQRVFGGQVLGQALMAASRTVPERLAHSLHGYFLIGGDPLLPIDYRVETLRDGGSFSTRRVVASQLDRPIFAMSASFHKDEPGMEHQAAMPDVPSPEALEPDPAAMRALLAAAPRSVRQYWNGLRGIELRPVDLPGFLHRDRPTASQSIWIRLRRGETRDPVLAQAMLAYASDLTLLDTSLRAHGRAIFESGLQIASLDHAMWFHRRFAFDDWLLYAADSPAAGGSRGFNRGMLFDRSGSLIASVAQEGLIRDIDKAPVL